jgi:hypothetical protein
MLLVYWNIFWKTFSQLASASLTAIVLGDATLNSNASPELIGLALFTSFIGGLVAVGIAFVRSPATSALAKATRSAVEKLVALIVAIPINSTADIVTFPKLVLGGLTIVVLSFVITFFQNQGSPAPTPEVVSSQG